MGRKKVCKTAPLNQTTLQFERREAMWFFNPMAASMGQPTMGAAMGAGLGQGMQGMAMGQPTMPPGMMGGCMGQGVQGMAMPQMGMHMVIGGRHNLSPCLPTTHPRKRPALQDASPTT